MLQFGEFAIGATFLVVGCRPIFHRHAEAWRKSELFTILSLPSFYIRLSYRRFWRLVLP